MSRPQHARRAARNTARFWVLHRDGWVRLALRWGQSVELTNGGLHDEGYHWTACTYTHAGDRVTCETVESWRDCDGPGWACSTSFAMLGKLRARVTADPVLCAPAALPEWELANRTQRDYFAEAEGY